MLTSWAVNKPSSCLMKGAKRKDIPKYGKWIPDYIKEYTEEKASYAFTLLLGAGCRTSSFSSIPYIPL